MPSKITLALVACVAYGAVSAMALPAQGAYDLSERDFAELEARMFDNGFEDFAARQVAEPPTAESPAASAAVAEPIPPAGAKTLAVTGASESSPHPHPHRQNGGGRRQHNAQHAQRRHRHRQGHNHVGAGTGAKEAAVPSSDTSAPVPAPDPSAPAPPMSAREAPGTIEARGPPAHQAGARHVSTRRPPRTPAEIIFDDTLDADQRRHELLAAKRYRDAVARREALQAARLKRKQTAPGVAPPAPAV